MKTPEKVGPKSIMDLYPDVCQWLETFLKDRFRHLNRHTMIGGAGL